MKDYLQAIITVLSLVNPAVCAPVFSQIEAGRHGEPNCGIPSRQAA